MCAVGLLERVAGSVHYRRVACARLTPVKGFTLGLVGIALTCIAAPLNAQQSLAEIANKEKERRDAITAPAKIYTNDDLVVSSRPPGIERPLPLALPAVSSASSLPDPRYTFPP